MDLNQRPYISCIKIGKQPIIPPLLTEDLKTEMRYYRDLAISLEKRKKHRRNSIDSGVMISSNDGSCPKKVDASEVQACDPLPTPDTNNDLVISTCGSSVESDHDDVFIETKTSTTPTQHNSCEEKVTLNISTEDNKNLSQRRNSYTINNSEIITLDSCEVPAVSERRSSYTLESPSPIMLQYLQSLQNNDSSERYELFIQSSDNDDVPDVIISENNNVNNERKELTLEDLFTNSHEYEDFQSSRLDMWDTRSDETLHKFLEADLRKFDSVRSSISNSPVSIVRACNSIDCVKNSTEELNSEVNLNNESVETVAAMNSSCECICNLISQFEPFRRSRLSDCVSPVKDHYNDNEDSFNRDFRLLDSSNQSCEESDAFIEGRYSECSSVSLTKFLSGDKLPDGLETEYAAFTYMKEQLEMKHRNEFKRLLKEQQKEHDNLKVQFNRVLLLPKHTSSSKCNYAYSDGVVLKKYTPSEHTTSILSCSVNEDCSKSSNPTSNKLVNAEMKRKTLPENMENINQNMTITEAASKINAAVRGFLTRRLFKTERVILLVQTIKDCLATAVSLQSETDLQLSELDLQSRLLQQLTVACNDLHSIFLLPLRERLSIITADREKKIRNSSKKRTPLPLSEATRRTLQRKIIGNSAPAAQRKYERRRCRSVSSTTSESTSCRSTPGSRRRLTAAIMSQKFSVSSGGRRPWR